MKPDSSQWVELYNQGDNSIDIGNWVIDDNGGSQKFTIPSGEIISSKGYKVYGSGLFNLNTTTEDTVRLLQNDTLIDSFTYSSGPPEGMSYGRESDGHANWVLFGTTSKTASNNPSSSVSLPTPSLTSTPTFTPVPSSTPQPTVTKTPTPPKTPTPIKTPTPTKVPTPTKTLTPFPVKSGAVPTVKSSSLSPSNTLVQLASNTSPVASRSFPTAVLGISSKQPSFTPSPSKRILVDSEAKERFSQLPVVAGIGVLLLAGGGAYYFIRKRSENSL